MTDLIILERQVERPVVDFGQAPVTEVVSLHGGSPGCQAVLGGQALRVHSHNLHTQIHVTVGHQSYVTIYTHRYM